MLYDDLFKLDHFDPDLAPVNYITLWLGYYDLLYKPNNELFEFFILDPCFDDAERTLLVCDDN